MPIIKRVDDAIRAAMRNNPGQLKLAAIILTEAQRFELMRDADPIRWQQVGAVEKYGGLVVITAPDLVFYTPRVLMGDR